MAGAYQSGFGSEFATEALAGALPVGRNSPQRPPYGLYAEQVSGTAFTAPRHANRRSWLYRIRPAVLHGAFEALPHPRLASAPFDATGTSPNQLRWDPFPMPEAPADFVDGLATIAGNGEAGALTGIAIHVYACNRSMRGRYCYDADGELLVVPQEGALRIATELGILDVAPGEIALLPRGIRFCVDLADGLAVSILKNRNRHPGGWRFASCLQSNGKPREIQRRMFKSASYSFFQTGRV
jgi:homogentisate 1,2-dioxygenase